MPYVSRSAGPAFRAPPLAAALAATLSLAAGACGGDAARETSVVVDTLPGGIPRTISAAPQEAGRWSLAVERVVQPAEGSDGELLNPIGLEISDDGHVLTFEQNPTQVRVYGPTGDYVRALGRSGKGPGEFSAGMTALRGDTIAVQDPMNQRLSVWDWRTGTLIGERRSACCVWSALGIDGEGNAWIPHMSDYADSSYTFARGFLRATLAGDASDSVWVLDRPSLPKPPQWELRQGTSMRMSMSVPLQPGVYIAIDPTGGLVTGYSGEYLLRVSSNGVDTTAIFGRRFAPIPVSGAEKTTLVDDYVRQSLRPGIPFDEVALRNAFDASLIPNQRPAFEGIAIDRAGRRWVELSTGDTTRTSFDLFDRDGRWLDTVHVPSDVWPMEGYPRVAWGRDHVAITAEGEDGRPMVRVLRIERQ